MLKVGVVWCNTIEPLACASINAVVFYLLKDFHFGCWKLAYSA
ncbi:Unknown protein sequence [Pseudomonas syringae pv. cilantro]|uniref:Uncharacterized protein n=1 Tax=Pseudomonas syringae pv. cilantro TaxID=81035 RepID=A0A0N1JNQ8_PSESX|nr:Unknown protein sequence [Pseudomonas syringae pv. cilantro]